MVQTQSHKVKEEYWRTVIGDWQASQLSAAEYCRQHQLGEAQFSHWKCKLFPQLNTAKKPIPQPPVFAEIVVASEPVTPQFSTIENTPIEVITPTGYCIKLFQGFDEVTFKKIIKLTGGSSC